MKSFLRVLGMVASFLLAGAAGGLAVSYQLSEGNGRHCRLGYLCTVFEATGPSSAVPDKTDTTHCLDKSTATLISSLVSGLTADASSDLAVDRLYSQNNCVSSQQLLHDICISVKGSLSGPSLCNRFAGQ